MTKFARYDLRHDICSFDFYNVAVIAAARGYRGFVFDGLDNPKCGKWPKPQVLERFHSIIEPGPAFLRMDCYYGFGGERIGHPHLRHLVARYRLGLDFPRLCSVQAPQLVEYTVTLRQEPRIPERNSNLAAWREFARIIGARVFEDYAVEPIPLHERMAYYAGARMNYGVPNGPLFLNFLSTYPVTLFACDRCAGAFGNAGIKFGRQFPWSQSNQRLVWEPDHLPTLLQHFEETSREGSRRDLVAG
jgi:hypothetical protein